MHLFLAPCRDFFSFAELCPCSSVCCGSQVFCTVTSPGGTQKGGGGSIKRKKSYTFKKRSATSLSMLRLLLPAAATLDEVGEANKRTERYRFLRMKPPTTSGLFYSWGGIMFAQRQLGAVEMMWDSVREHIHMWPSHCLSHLGCNVSCNPSHFCLRFGRLRQSPGHDCSKIHLFIQKEDMSCG